MRWIRGENFKMFPAMPFLHALIHVPDGVSAPFPGENPTPRPPIGRPIGVVNTNITVRLWADYPGKVAYFPGRRVCPALVTPAA